MKPGAEPEKNTHNKLNCGLTISPRFAMGFLFNRAYAPRILQK